MEERSERASKYSTLCSSESKINLIDHCAVLDLSFPSLVANIHNNKHAYNILYMIRQVKLTFYIIRTNWSFFIYGPLLAAWGIGSCPRLESWRRLA
jgi:hypothetical protein